MNDTQRFSERFGFAPAEKAITIQHEAPPELRDATLAIAYEAGFGASSLRNLICRALRKRPDPNNWSTGNVEFENGQLIDDCEWYEVYEIIERIYNTDEARFFERSDEKERNISAKRLTGFFKSLGSVGN